MRARLVAALPLIVATLSLGVGAHRWVGAAALLAATLLAIAIGPRLRADNATQGVAALVLVALVIAGIRAEGVPAARPPMGALSYGLAFIALLTATLRIVMIETPGRPRLDIALALVGELATGAGQSPLYLPLFGLFLVAALVSLRAQDPTRLPLARLSSRTRALATILLAVAAVLSVGVALTLRTTSELARSTAERAFLDYMQTARGLNERARIGNMSSLLSSETVVLRISGPAGDRIRGVVLDQYRGGVWSSSHEQTPLRQASVPTGPLRGGGAVEIRTVNPDGDRLLLPLDANEIAAEAGSVRFTPFGTLHLPKHDADTTLWYRPGRRDAFDVDAARDADRAIPPELERPLVGIAKEWTAETETPAEALRALERHLAQYTYSLDSHPGTHLDPVLDFLFVSRRGQCEYFATAMTLLARASGIPARLVLGYRVAEQNTVTGHFVVRRKNAHAWVEAEYGGQWHTHDPTPMIELPQDAPHTQAGFGAYTEAAALLADQALSWVARRSVFELGGAAIAGLVLFIAQRRWRERQSGSRPAEQPTFTPPLEAYVALERALARKDLARARHESLEAWAARLPHDEIARVVLRYARVRYGAVEDAGLSNDLLVAARSIE
jgi:hypothetical protein